MNQLNISIYSVEKKLNHYGLSAKGRWRLTYYKNAQWLLVCSRAF